MSFYKLDLHRTFLVSQKALITQGDRLLMLESAPNPTTGRSRWELPGGMLEMDESLSDGLLREVREETGLRVAIGKLVAAWDHREPEFTVRDGRVLDVRIIEIAFECELTAGEIRLSEEHRNFKWITHDEFATLDFSQNSTFAIETYWSENRA